MANLALRQRTIGERMLVGTPFRVLVRGSDVVLEINGREVPAMSPDTAIDIAIGLKHGARVVKERMRLPRGLHGIADLTDAVADEREMQNSRDATAFFSRG